MKNINRKLIESRRSTRNINRRDTKLGRPRGSTDRHGRCNRVDRVSLRRTAWRAFAVAFGRRLTELLTERDVAASELAAALDVSVMTVLAWKRGRSVPPSIQLAAIASALSCAFVDLLPEQAYSAGGVA